MSRYECGYHRRAHLFYHPDLRRNPHHRHHVNSLLVTLIIIGLSIFLTRNLKVRAVTGGRWWLNSSSDRAELS